MGFQKSQFECQTFLLPHPSISPIFFLFFFSDGSPKWNVLNTNHNNPIMSWSPLSNLSEHNWLVRQVSVTGVPNMFLWRLPHQRPLIWTASLHKTLRLQCMRAMYADRRIVFQWREKIPTSRQIPRVLWVIYFGIFIIPTSEKCHRHGRYACGTILPKK